MGVEVDVSKKIFSRLNTFLQYSKSEQDNCDKYIELEIKVNGKSCKPTKCIESGTNGQRLRIENPLQTFEYLKHFHDNKYRIDKIFHTFLSLAFTNHNPIDGKCDYSIMLLTNNELIWNINYTQNTK